MSRGGRKLQVVPPAALSAEEQALLAAYSAMDEQGRVDALSMAIWSAENYPAPAMRGRRFTIMVATQADEQALLRDYRAMGADARSDFCCIATAFAAERQTRPGRPPRLTLAHSGPGRAQP